MIQRNDVLTKKESSKKKAPPKEQPSKLCIRCGRVLPMSSFYENRQWHSQMYRDAWCKECAAKYCVDKDTLKAYCYDNNRAWIETQYTAAEKQARYELSTNPVFIDPKVSARKKKLIEGQTIAHQFFFQMNRNIYYVYVENAHDNQLGEDGKPLIKSDKPADEFDPPKYNRKWRGHFTNEQIQTLEDIYRQYEEGFVLENVNVRDYAMKVAKASLNADIAEDKFRRGELSASEYKEAQKIFDDLSKSANFAACRRKPGETTGLGSQGEIIYKIEITGKLNTDGFHWEQDSIDQAVAEYRHSQVAAGLDGTL